MSILAILNMTPTMHEFNHHLLNQLALQLQQESGGYFSSVRPPAATRTASLL